MGTQIVMDNHLALTRWHVATRIPDVFAFHFLLLLVTRKLLNLTISSNSPAPPALTGLENPVSGRQTPYWPGITSVQGKGTCNSVSRQYAIQPPASEVMYREGVARAVAQEMSPTGQKSSC